MLIITYEPAMMHWCRLLMGHVISDVYLSSCSCPFWSPFLCLLLNKTSGKFIEGIKLKQDEIISYFCQINCSLAYGSRELYVGLYAVRNFVLYAYIIGGV